MTMDAIYEEQRSDWSHQVPAMVTACSMTRPFFSLRRVWLARLTHVIAMQKAIYYATVQGTGKRYAR